MKIYVYPFQRLARSGSQDIHARRQTTDRKAFQRYLKKNSINPVIPIADFDIPIADFNIPVADDNIAMKNADVSVADRNYTPFVTRNCAK
jgi:hypothetical protein